MANPTDCLTGLIGLSKNGIPCFPLPAESAYVTDSATGLYLDTVEGLNLKPAQSTSPGADLYPRLDRARTQAMEVVYQHLSTRAAAQAGKKLFTLSGMLSGLGNGQLGIEGSARMVLYTRERTAGRWRLQSLQLLTDIPTANVPVLLDGVEIASISTNSPPVALTDAFVPFDGQPHTLEAVLPPGVRPKFNTLICGGCSEWGRLMKLNLAPNANPNAPAGGFVVKAKEECTVAPLVCHVLSQDEELKRSIAWAILYKTAEHVVVGFLADAAYSRYTTLEPKAMQALGELYHAKAAEHLNWLSGPEGLAKYPHPCYQCAPSAWHPSIVKTH